MKKFENPFRAILELSRVGDEMVNVKVSTSLRLCPLDQDTVSGVILSKLLPATVCVRQFFNGSYLVFSGEAGFPLTVRFIPKRPYKFEFDVSLELEDGKVHTVHVCLSQAPDARRDYTVNDFRSLILVGTISVEVDNVDEYETAEN